MITKEQIRAARALLDWSQKTLADQCESVSTPTIKLIESGRSHSTPGTLGDIQKTLEDAGLEFLPQNGVRQRDDLLTVLEKQNENDDIYLRLLDDIYYTMKGTYGEILWSFIDESVSSDEIIEREHTIRKDGLTVRALVRHGDTHLTYPLDEYRYIPKGHYLNNPYVVYGDKFAVVVGNEEKIIIIRDKAVTELKRKEFDIIWSLGSKPNKTTAEVTYYD